MRGTNRPVAECDKKKKEGLRRTSSNFDDSPVLWFPFDDGTVSLIFTWHG
jgi:hypothetical protein